MRGLMRAGNPFLPKGVKNENKSVPRCRRNEWLGFPGMKDGRGNGEEESPEGGERSCH